MGKQQTLEALEIFIRSQRSLLARTQSDIERLKELRRDATHSENFFTTLDDRLDFRVDDGDVAAEVHRTLDWSLFKGRDSTALRAFTSQVATAHQCRSQPSTNQRSPLSPLQQLVKDARRTIVDPVLATFADMSDPSDEEDELTPEERRKERERQKIRELRTRRIGEGGLTLPRGRAGVFIRRDLQDESAEVDIALDEKDVGFVKPDTSSLPESATRISPTTNFSLHSLSRARRTPAKPPSAERPPISCAPTKIKRSLDPDPQPEARPGKRSRDANKPKSDTYKQAWSVSEQHLLERLLEEIPDGEKNRWAKISKAMQGRRTPRQVASRVQKYFEKLKRFGVELGAGEGTATKHMDDDDPP